MNDKNPAPSAVPDVVDPPAESCPRCGSTKAEECVIAPAVTMADLADGTRVRERFGVWPRTGTIRSDDLDLLVAWDRKPHDSGPSAVTVTDGSALLGSLPVDQLELVNPDEAAIPSRDAVQVILDATGARPSMIVLIGAAGSGKSTIARRLAAAGAGQVLSSDEMRKLISGSECDQSATEEAFGRLHRTADARLSRGLPTIVDATSLTAGDREPLLAIARRNDTAAVAVVMATLFNTCRTRNAARPGPAPGERWGRRVPGTVLCGQHAARLKASVPALTAEGFARVILVGPDPEQAAE